MSGPKRNPDRLNTIGVVVVGICGAVLVYVTIVRARGVLRERHLGDPDHGRLRRPGHRREVAADRPAEPDQRVRHQPAAGGGQARRGAADADLPGADRCRDEARRRGRQGRSGRARAGDRPLGQGHRAADLRPAQSCSRRPPRLATPAAPATPAAGCRQRSQPPARPLRRRPRHQAAPMVPTGAGTGPAPVGGAGPLDKPAAPGTPGHPTGPAPATANPPAAPAAGTPTERQWQVARSSRSPARSRRSALSAASVCSLRGPRWRWGHPPDQAAAPAPSAPPAAPDDEIPPPPPTFQAGGVTVDEHLGARVPLDARFRTQDGVPITLGEALGGGLPAILTFTIPTARCCAT